MTPFRTFSAVGACFALGALVGVACSDSTSGLGTYDGGFAGAGGGVNLPFGQGGASNGNGGGAAGGDAGKPGKNDPSAGGAGGTADKAVSCAAGSSQCNDGMDNDNDGLTDALDRECSGPCDDDEGSFATGISGDNMDDEKSCHQDCFFDGNSGPGDDGCRWDLRCDPLRKGLPGKCGYNENGGAAMCPASQSDVCINLCRSRTPNGCDCFGCCTIPGQDFSVKLVATCTAADFGNPEKCPRCTPTTTCQNTCGRCEVCIGKPTPEPDCPRIDGGQPSTPPPGYDGGVADGPVVAPPPAPFCEGGKTSCGPGGQVPANGCPGGSYCITGCCDRLVE